VLAIILTVKKVITMPNETSEKPKKFNPPIWSSSKEGFPFSTAIFENEKGDSYNLQKGFKRTPEGEWEKQSISVFPHQLPKLKITLDELIEQDKVRQAKREEDSKDKTVIPEDKGSV